MRFLRTAMLMGCAAVLLGLAIDGVTVNLPRSIVLAVLAVIAAVSAVLPERHHH